MSLMAAMESSQVSITEFPLVLALMRTLEQILSVHPTPSSLTVRLDPLGKVIFDIRPNECCFAGGGSSRFGPLAPCIVNVLPTSRMTARQLMRIEVFI